MLNRDHHTKQRQQFIRQQSSHAQKLQDSIEWLKARGKYCLATPLEIRIYTSVNGIPLAVVK